MVNLFNIFQILIQAYLVQYAQFAVKSGLKFEFKMCYIFLKKKGLLYLVYFRIFFRKLKKKDDNNSKVTVRVSTSISHDEQSNDESKQEHEQSFVS